MKLWQAISGPQEPLREKGGRLELFGLPFTPLDLPGAVEELAGRLARGERGITVFTPDAWATSRSLLDPSYLELYGEANLVVCDGVGVAFAARALGGALPHVPGVDLAWALCARAREEGWSVYLLGGRPGVAERARGRLERSFPGIRVVGAHHGCFRGAGPEGEIARLRPDLLFVGMGFPRQERWILAHQRSGAGVLMGVGGAFDLWAGRVPRAPKPIRRAGLEWLWRATVQPHRIPRLWCVPFLLYHTLLGRLKKG
ncbi:MAG: Glycosyl transferase, WecB/TagA/CpsF family [Acetothermia bacterium 64_32]|nr:MAG: Glycosyl transferase, WecB/TagA/CpsF family [Acetothermia bacterium 64_32]HAF70049.1 glycosyltransferase [Candidatus Acetothermia bacterium]